MLCRQTSISARHSGQSSPQARPGTRRSHLAQGTSGNPPGNRTGNVTRTLLQNIEVLSAGQDFKKDSEGKPVVVQVVNLLVTPEQAEMLSLASNQTTIQLVLRNPLDTQMAKTPGTAVVELFAHGGPRKRPERLSRLRRLCWRPAKNMLCHGGQL